MQSLEVFWRSWLSLLSSEPRNIGGVSEMFDENRVCEAA